MSISLSGLVQGAPKILLPVATYVGGAALGVTGLVLSFQAKATRVDAESRAVSAQPARAALDQAVGDFNSIRITSYEATVDRLLSWLELNQDAIEHLDIALADGEIVRVWAPPETGRAVGSGNLPAQWLLTASSAGAPLQKAVFWAVQKRAVAGTGQPMAALHGAALRDAVLAWLGNGTLANGGMGRAGGEVVLESVKYIPVAVVSGLVAAAAGLNAKAEANVFARAVDGQIAFVEAAAERVGTLQVKLRDRCSRATTAIDALEEDGGAPNLAEAFAAVAAVGAILTTPIFDAETGELSAESARLL